MGVVDGVDAAYVYVARIQRKKRAEPSEQMRWIRQIDVLQCRLNGCLAQSRGI